MVMDGPGLFHAKNGFFETAQVVEQRQMMKSKNNRLSAVNSIFVQQDMEASIKVFTVKNFNELVNFSQALGYKNQ